MSRQLDEGATALVDSAARVAGVIAARGRGDLPGARELLTSFDSHAELAQGSLLVAELALQSLSDQTGQPLEECVHLLSLRLLSLDHEG